MSNEIFIHLTQPQPDRLAFAALRVRLIEKIRCQDLGTRFGIQSAAPHFDIARSLHKELTPGYRSPDQNKGEQ
jgi:hypothetical protein